VVDKSHGSHSGPDFEQPEHVARIATYRGFTIIWIGRQCFSDLLLTTPLTWLSPLRRRYLKRPKSTLNSARTKDNWTQSAPLNHFHFAAFQP
jgi:hypothetical protein